MKRGEVWWAVLGKAQGNESGFRRPVLIVQDDLLTESRLSTVMIVPLTSNQRRAAAIGNVVLEARDTGLPRAAVALVCQVMIIDKTWLLDRAGMLPKRATRKVDAGLELALGLSAG